jgi:ubiquinol-cytochrome c reductase cytochrome c subunit
MRFRVFVFWRYVALLGVCFSVQASAQTQPASTGNVQAGKDLYLRYSCYACHSYDGHGGAGARLVPMRMTGERFTAYVRSPRTQQMPLYSTKLLTDAQLGDVWAYIKSLPVSPEAKDIPLLARIMRGGK